MYDAVSLWSAKNVQLFHGKIVWIYKKSHQNRSKGGGCHKNLEFSKSFFVLFGRKGWVLNFYLKFKKYFSTFWQGVGGSKFFTQNPKSTALLAHMYYVCQFVLCPPPLLIWDELLYRSQCWFIGRLFFPIPAFLARRAKKAGAMPICACTKRHCKG